MTFLPAPRGADADDELHVLGNSGPTRCAAERKRPEWPMTGLEAAARIVLHRLDHGRRPGRSPNRRCRSQSPSACSGPAKPIAFQLWSLMLPGSSIAALSLRAGRGAERDAAREERGGQVRAARRRETLESELNCKTHDVSPRGFLEWAECDKPVQSVASRRPAAEAAAGSPKPQSRIRMIGAMARASRCSGSRSTMHKHAAMSDVTAPRRRRCPARPSCRRNSVPHPRRRAGA